MNTALSIALSTVFHIKDNPYLPCPAVIKFHNIGYTLTCYTDSALLMHSMLSSNYIAVIHNIFSLHTHEHALHTRTTHPLPSTTLLCTPLTQNIVGKMAQDVGMVESIVVSSPSSLVGF